MSQCNLLKSGSLGLQGVNEGNISCCTLNQLSDSLLKGEVSNMFKTTKITKFAMICAVALTLSACSGDDEAVVDKEAGMQRETITDNAPLNDVYGENTQGVEPGTQADLVTNVGDRVFFGYDSHDLSAEARSVLEAQAEWLQRYPNLSVTVEGHADERGTREYNLALGERRANSAKNYLTALGVSPSRINTISYGKERPAVPGSNE
jgi:peptidoglycan-associated lipoprotein